MAALGLCFLLAACRPAPDGDATANWPHHGADHSASKYAPHGQIDRGNFSELEIAWTWGSADSRIDEELRYFTGEHVWQIPFGKGPTDHPAIDHLNLGPLGSVFNDIVAEGGVLITESLLISYLGACAVGIHGCKSALIRAPGRSISLHIHQYSPQSISQGRGDSEFLRRRLLAQKDEIDPEATGSILVAHDKETGELVGEVMVNQRLHGAPISYEHEGRQYIAVAGGGRNGDFGELVVFALP